MTPDEFQESLSKEQHAALLAFRDSLQAMFANTAKDLELLYKDRIASAESKMATAEESLEQAILQREKLQADLDITASQLREAMAARDAALSVIESLASEKTEILERTSKELGDAYGRITELAGERDGLTLANNGLGEEVVKLQALVDELNNQLHPVIPVLGAHQLRLWLVGAGIPLSSISQAIETIQDDSQREAARIAWDYAPTISRSHPLVAMLGKAIGLDHEALDHAFQQAAKL